MWLQTFQHTAPAAGTVRLPPAASRDLNLMQAIERGEPVTDRRFGMESIDDILRDIDQALVVSR